MNESTWIGIAALAITGVFGWLNKRVSLRYDRELDAMKAEQAKCKEESKRCDEQHSAARTELEVTRRELAARDARDKADLQAQLDALKGQLKNSGALPHGSADHKPV